MVTPIAKKLSVLTISWMALAVSYPVISSQEEAGASAHAHKHDHGHGHGHGHAHNHDHGHTHDHSHDQDIYAGYFKDSQVRGRSLSDWQGDWQSVYPYLQKGALDQVFAHKAEHGGKKAADEYKAYYEEGYRTGVGRVVIDGKRVTFYKNGESLSGDYAYDGYEILTYEAGNRGVRFIFEQETGPEALPQFIQFSDHNIYPTKADHYHLYWGDDRAALLEEVTNWPTYYSSELSGEEIAREMMAH